MSLASMGAWPIPQSEVQVPNILIGDQQCNQLAPRIQLFSKLWSNDVRARESETATAPAERPDCAA
jgi:hypothetical protein